MSIVPKKISEIDKTDYKEPIILWVHSSEIFCIARHSTKISLRDAKKLSHVCYEFNDFLYENVEHHTNRIYYGYSIHSKNGLLKFIVTNKGTLHNIY